MPVTHPTGPVTHPTGGGNLVFICLAGVACCVVGVIFLYKAVTCTEFRETDEGERKTRASLLWVMAGQNDVRVSRTARYWGGNIYHRKSVEGLTGNAPTTYG
jgi:hypothetical protein